MKTGARRLLRVLALCLLVCLVATGCGLLPEEAADLLAPPAGSAAASRPEPISLPQAQPRHPVLCLLPPLDDAYTTTLARALQDTAGDLGMEVTMAAGASSVWLEALHPYAEAGGRVVVFCPGRAVSLEMLSAVSEARALGLLTLAYGAPLEDGDANLQFFYGDIGYELGRMAGETLLEAGAGGAENADGLRVLFIAPAGDPNSAAGADGMREGLAQTTPQAAFEQAAYSASVLENASLPGDEAATILVCAGSKTALLAAEALAADATAAEGVLAIYCMGLGSGEVYTKIAEGGLLQAACGTDPVADAHTLMVMAGQLAQNGSADSQDAPIAVVRMDNTQNFITTTQQ